MKLFNRSILILMFGLVPAGLAASDGAQFPEDANRMLIEQMCSAAFPAHVETGTQKEVSISYLLDQDGKPYIISIHSDDQQVNRMIRNMLRERNEVQSTALQAQDEETLDITFYYNHIR